jgi:hypothetical protein
MHGLLAARMTGFAASRGWGLAPDWKPKRAIAVATANSKKLLAPINAEGPATHHSTPNWRFSQ